MKLYKVKLFIMREGTNLCSFVDTIIVQKGLTTMREAITGYSNINVVEMRHIKPRPYLHLKDDSCYLPKKTSNGNTLFVLKEDFSKYNLVNEKDITSYVSSYEKSKWKELHDEVIQEGKKKEQK